MVESGVDAGFRVTAVVILYAAHYVVSVRADTLLLPLNQVLAGAAAIWPFLCIELALDAGLALLGGLCRALDLQVRNSPNE